LYCYYIIYKPYGVLSQFTTSDFSKIGLGSLFNFPRDVYPVGRLDEDSEGLLILTNDPRQNALLLGNGVEKSYWVQVEGRPTMHDLSPLTKGMSITIKGRRTPPIRFRLSVPDTWLKLRLREGKNRQVRRMTAALGFPTLRLVRWSFGPFTVQGMEPGEVRVLDRDELSFFNQIV
jgi:23S rRNA pseudouridine2457 synthase